MQLMFLRVQKERMEKSYFPNNREYSMLFGLDTNKINNIKKDILIFIQVQLIEGGNYLRNCGIK